MVLQADQADVDALQDIGSRMGPFDLVVDDASHVGQASWSTFQGLWPYVAQGGLYVIEDWATGYWADWSDGREYQPCEAPGHAAGMVGVVKRLIDEIEYGDVDSVELRPGLAFLRKRLRP